MASTALAGPAHALELTLHDGQGAQMGVSLTNADGVVLQPIQCPGITDGVPVPSSITDGVPVPDGITDGNPSPTWLYDPSQCTDLTDGQPVPLLGGDAHILADDSSWAVMVEDPAVAASVAVAVNADDVTEPVVRVAEAGASEMVVTQFSGELSVCALNSGGGACLAFAADATICGGAALAVGASVTIDDTEVALCVSSLPAVVWVSQGQ